MQTAFAAPCCTSNAVVPSLITTESVAQISTRVSNSHVVGHTLESGQAVFHNRRNVDSSAVLELAGAASLGENLFKPKFHQYPKWQAHFTLPFSYRVRRLENNDRSHGGLSDISFGLAYEALEEQGLDSMLPRLWVYLDTTMPTGKSADEAQRGGDFLMGSSHGRGFWSMTAGVFALKDFRVVKESFDASLLLLHREDMARKGFIRKALTSVNAALGWNSSWARLSAGIGPSFENRALLQSGRDETANALLRWDVFFLMAAQLSEDWNMNLSYLDQTLVGPTHNAELNRSLTLGLIKRFSL